MPGITQERPVSIHILGQDRTRQLRDWTLWWDDQHSVLKLTYHFHSGKSFHSPLGDCRVTPTRELGKSLLTKALLMTRPCNPSGIR